LFIFFNNRKSEGSFSSGIANILKSFSMDKDSGKTTANVTDRQHAGRQQCEGEISHADTDHDDSATNDSSEDDDSSEGDELEDLPVALYSFADNILQDGAASGRPEELTKAEKVDVDSYTNSVE
jgi:hypothetical protein